MSHTEATATTATATGAHVPHTGAGRPADREVVVTEDGRVLNDPTHAQRPDHGNSPAGWAMAGLVVAGFLLGCIGLLSDLWLLVWIGAAVVVVGALVGFLGGRATRGASHRSH